MSIRSSAKAIIMKDGKILMNKCRRPDGRQYIALPGGGQDEYEALEDAVVREIKEETGYDARVVRFAALAEEIRMDPDERQRNLGYAHRMLHIFIAELTGEAPEKPKEPDYQMEESIWLTPDELRDFGKVYPPTLPGRLEEILNGDGAVWLGTVYL